MGNEIAIAGPAVDMATITEYLDITGLTKSLLPNEKAMFITMCQSYGLNPFKREIYCTAFGQGQYRQCSIVTGYEVYLKRAERTGKLDGWKAEVAGNVNDGSLAAKVTIYRKDWSHPFEHIVYYKEVVQTKKDGTPNRFWATQPTFMIRKVAMAQAFRLCFPDENGGMPYTNDELGVEQEAPRVERNVTPQEPPKQEPAQELPQAEPPKQPSQIRLDLEGLLDSYGVELSGKPYGMTRELLNNPNATDEELGAMMKRCKDYLARKGISV